MAEYAFSDMVLPVTVALALREIWIPFCPITAVEPAPLMMLSESIPTEPSPRMSNPAFW